MVSRKIPLILGLLTVFALEVSGVLVVDFSTAPISSAIQIDYCDIALDLDGTPVADPSVSVTNTSRFGHLKVELDSLGF